MSLPVLDRGLDHIAIRACDLDASVAFHTEALGSASAPRLSRADTPR